MKKPCETKKMRSDAAAQVRECRAKGSRVAAKYVLGAYKRLVDALDGVSAKALEQYGM